MALEQEEWQRTTEIRLKSTRRGAEFKHFQIRISSPGQHTRFWATLMHLSLNGIRVSTTRLGWERIPKLPCYDHRQGLIAQSWIKGGN